MIEGEAWDNLNESIKPIMFKYGFLEPSSWIRKATRLKYAADQLYEIYETSNARYLERFTEAAEAGTGPVIVWHKAPQAELGKEIADISLLTEYCLLMGYAIENLLKGLLMAIHPDYFKSGTKVTAVQSHSLINLCKRCSVAITPDEEDLLTRLTEHIVWVAKYPVPLELAQMYPRRQADGTWDGPLNKFAGEKTKRAAEDFYGRLRAELEQHQNTEEDREPITRGENDDH